jgi:hypothetical protein
MNRPEHWLWSHDIKSDQLASLGPRGWSLVSLSSYGGWNHRRFAAIVHKTLGAGRIPLLDLSASEAAERLRHLRVRPVAVTAGPGPRPLLSVLAESAPGESRLAADLSEDDVRALGTPGGVADIATYTIRGARRYSVVLDPNAGPTLLFTGVTEAQLRRELRRSDATVTRLRSWLQDGELLLTAVAEPSSGGSSHWYAGLDADGVARKLDRHRAYPVDLDATRHDEGVRYTVVMRR